MMILEIKLNESRQPVIEMHDCYEVKDIVKAKGYTWDPFTSVWSKQITAETFREEVDDMIKTLGLKPSQLTTTKEVNDFLTGRTK